MPTPAGPNSVTSWIETARHYLGARDIDGVVIGDGFNRSTVEDFVEELAADPRWRDLPVIVPRDAARELDPERMPNVDQVSGDPQAVAAHILPFARLHAFAARLKRVTASLDQKGVVAPDTGLLTHAAFIGELERAAIAASRGAGLSLARLTFDCFANRRASMDAARITARLLRASDLACRDEDGTILIAFPGNRSRDRACGGAAHRKRAQAHDACGRRRAHAASVRRSRSRPSARAIRSTR